MTRPQPSAPDFGSAAPFAPRHHGSSAVDDAALLGLVGVKSTAQLIDETVPSSIRLGRELELAPALGEREVVEELHRIADKNIVQRSLIGCGYYGTALPAVIQRNVLENPGWYTQYTPYQAEISQGRLEALLNFQTLVSDLTGLPLAGASLLDEATSAAEALAMCHGLLRGKRDAYFVSRRCHPQTIEVVRTRARAAGVEVHVGEAETFDFEGTPVAGVLVQVPDTFGLAEDLRALSERIHASGAKLVVATDLLALTELVPPGEMGADIAIGSAQRFGIPLGYGGPHAAFLSASEDFKRLMPGRIIGMSIDSNGNPALRMAMQTREQHIRRDKATSNICTAQVLLAVLSSFYAVYHGPEGLQRMARRIRALTLGAAKQLADAGYTIAPGPVFDTLHVSGGPRFAAELHAETLKAGFNLRSISEDAVGVSFDELSSPEELQRLLACFGVATTTEAVEATAVAELSDYPSGLHRSTPFMEHAVFHAHRTEHELLRYIKRLEARDLSLVHSMIPLGSCTMKLNATTEMLALSFPGFSDIHPFAPLEQATGYAELFQRLEADLAEITGFDRISLQPNAGSQGEYAGLLAIRGYHEARGETHRRVCLIPTSAHGTNPASAVMAGMRVVPVNCDDQGNIDLEDLESKAAKHKEELGALMVTYPSTHGVFEIEIKRICAVIHEHGGRVYMDGANMNAMVGVCRPGDFGADVCHLNLHKTFCIPHGGGGPGMGPIGVVADLAPYLPSHPFIGSEGIGSEGIGPIASAPWGSASILTISWTYIAMMGAAGLREATERAILNANYMAKRLGESYDVLFTGPGGRVAHEFILDLRPFEKSAGVSAEDVAKRLMDYGYHAPTMSWPVVGTIMIEPTESETRSELDRFCDALLMIREEIRAIEEGRLPKDDNPLSHAPHTAAVVTAEDWTRPYPREQAAFPAPWTRAAKFWPHVGRIDNGYGDRNLVCTCPPMESYAEPAADEPELTTA